MVGDGEGMEDRLMRVAAGDGVWVNGFEEGQGSGQGVRLPLTTSDGWGFCD